MNTEYQLFLCDITKQHAPICVIFSDLPFPYLSCGQRFDDHGWPRLDGTVLGSEDAPIRYTIHSIKHVVKCEVNKNIFQTGLNLEPHYGSRSPAFESAVALSWSQAVALQKSLLIKET